MRCNDEFIGYLKPLGYSVLRLPRSDVQPLQLLAAANGDLSRLGELSQVLVPRRGVFSALPELRRGAQCATVAGRRSSEMSPGVALTVLGSVIQAMGGSGLGLEAKYERARSVQFEFPEVWEDSVEVTALDQFLTACDVNPLSTHVGALLESDDVYVVTHVLKARRLSVRGTANDGGSLEVAVPELQQAVGATVKVSADSERATVITYEGPAQLAFGFQAVRLFYKDGRYTAFEFAPPGKKAMRGAESGAAPFQAEGPFVRLSF